MIKIIFGVISVGILYYVLTPLLGRRVGWVDAEDPDDERMRELELTKRINLKALKDIEFELASSKINDEDYLELREHYSRKVARIMGLIEDLTEEEEGSREEDGELEGTGSGETLDREPEEDPEDDEELELDEEDPGEDRDEDEDEDDEDDEDEDDGDDDEILQGRDGDDEDEEWDEDEEYGHRSVKGPTLAVLALVLTVGVGVALFQMGKRSAAPVVVALAPASPAPVAPAPAIQSASQPAPSSDQAGLEHLVQYVQENPWNVTSHIILGEYYLDAGNTSVALAHFLSADEIKPGNGRVLSNMGKTYRKLGNTDQAIEKFKAAADAETESLEHLYQLGLVYGYEKGDRTQAFILFEEILSRQPSDKLRATVDEETRKLAEQTGRHLSIPETRPTPVPPLAQ